MEGVQPALVITSTAGIIIKNHLENIKLLGFSEHLY